MSNNVTAAATAAVTARAGVGMTNNAASAGCEWGCECECVGLRALLAVGFIVTSHSVLPVLEQYMQHPQLLLSEEVGDTTITTTITPTARYHRDVCDGSVDLCDPHYFTQYIHTYPYELSPPAPIVGQGQGQGQGSGSSSRGAGVRVGCGGYQLQYPPEPDPESHMNEWTAWYECINTQLDIISKYK